MRRVFAIFGIQLLILSLVTLLPAKPVKADSPLVNWSANVNDTATSLSLLLGNTDASAHIGWCDYQPASPQKPYILQTFSIDTASQQVPSSTTLRPYICDDLSATSVVDKNGVVYAKTIDSQGISTLAKATNNQLTSLGAPPDGCPNCPNTPTIHSMAIGADENLYILTRQMDSGTYYFSFVKYDTNQHAFATSTPLFSTPWANVSMGLHQNGLVVSYANNIRYYSFSGVAQSSPLTPPNYMEWDKDVPPVTPDGHTYIGNSQEVTPSPSCSLSFVTSSLEVYTTNSHNSITLEACQYLRGIRVTPNNGAVVLLQAANNQQKLVSYDSSGMQKWSKPLVTSIGDRTYGDAVEHTRVDQNGNIVLWRDYTQDGARHMQIDSLSGSSGNVLWTADTRDIDDGSSFFQISRSAALTNNHFYLTMYRCEGAMTSGCTDNPKLYSFNIPGTTMEYPKAAILDPNHRQPLKYVALGDSFSAGQGVERFDFWTNIGSGLYENKCHRSIAAYPRQLAGMLNQTIHLRDFVACSGATSHNITTIGQYNEPKQIDAVQDADIVSITIGGNDIKFSDIIAACIADPLPHFDCEDKIEGAKTTMTTTLPSALHTLLAAIKQQAKSNAKILVIGYPNLLPSDENLVAESCAWGPLLPNMPSSMRTELRGLSPQLNQVLDDAAEDAGVIFIDPSPTFVGHEICTANPYIYPAQLTHLAYSFHPNFVGHIKYAELIGSEL